jgi:hypothetical protein
MTSNMKAKLHIPTEQYGFVEVEYEGDDPVTEYWSIANMVKETEGYNVTEWAKIRNNYMKTGEIHPDLIQGASRAQKHWINETKNAFKAIKQ